MSEHTESHHPPSSNFGETGHDDHVAHTSLKGYFMVFGALMVLTFFTVLVAKAEALQLEGYGNITVAMAIAVCKASLVLYFFMHLRESARIIKYTAVLGFLTLGLLLVFGMSDIHTRDLNPFPEPFTELDYQ